jgi:hypothetical protein
MPEPDGRPHRMALLVDQCPEAYSFPPLSSDHHRLKKIMHHYDCAPRSTSPRLPHTPSAFLSTAATPAPPRRAPPQLHHHGVISTRGRTTRAGRRQVFAKLLAAGMPKVCTKYLIFVLYTSKYT